MPADETRRALLALLLDHDCEDADLVADRVLTLVPEGRAPRLAGAREACEILGVAGGNLYKVAGLPEPLQELASGKVWRESDVRRLARKRDAAAKSG